MKSFSESLLNKYFSKWAFTEQVQAILTIQTLTLSIEPAHLIVEVDLESIPRALAMRLEYTLDEVPYNPYPQLECNSIAK